MQQTRLQTLNTSLQDLEIARSSQLDVGQYQSLIQSIVCSASLLNKKKLAALKQQKRQQSNLRRKIKKDVEKFNQMQSQRLPQLLGKNKSQPQMEGGPPNFGHGGMSTHMASGVEISILDQGQPKHAGNSTLQPLLEASQDQDYGKDGGNEKHEDVDGQRKSSHDNDPNHKRYNKKNQSVDIRQPSEVALLKQFEANFSLKSQRQQHLNDPIKLGDIAKKRRKALIELSKQQHKKAKRFSLKVPDKEESHLPIALKNKIKLVRNNHNESPVNMKMINKP